MRLSYLLKHATALPIHSTQSCTCLLAASRLWPTATTPSDTPAHSSRKPLTFACACCRATSSLTQHIRHSTDVMPWITADAAADRGDLELMALLVKRSDRLCRRAIAPRYSTSSRFPSRLVFTATAMDAASARGHVHVLRWWVDEFAGRGVGGSGVFKYTEAAIDHGSAHGHVDTLDWCLFES
ncbi:hypothetical protein BCR44DRAFT_340663 [Catenaria anguillulae PL171]|uniref:Uncharacterized protein n=1 Tax=Catenaria anguillulae PL171 TaxID=765915 RepID=A0A1Y2HJ49_9FUNG|nr:hypothetical protein BCR44DRAFT_340663 [Catenaria anguillulae PL171]